MLYEMLAGCRPFPSTRELTDELRHEAPELPDSPAIPQDLRELCMALLRRDPARRPTGREVFERLQERAASTLTAEPASGTHVLVGREQHLAALSAAWDAVCAGSPVTVDVHGASGMGKTALVQHFLERVDQYRPALVLRGRCHERESVPYKGVDDLIDSLTRHLGNLPSRTVQDLLPEAGMAELIRVFPVLRQVDLLSTLAGALTAAAAALDGGGRPAPSPKAAPVRLAGGIFPARQHASACQRQAGTERLCRYGARGALAPERLSRAEDGRIAYRMKRPLPDGTTHLLFTGLELLRRVGVPGACASGKPHEVPWRLR